MEIDCRRCKVKYQDCLGKVWYSVEDIRWCDKQVIWLIEHFILLTRDGIVTQLDWPTNPDGSSDIDLPGIRKSRRGDAYFTKPAEVVAELAVRLKKLGRSGELLVAELIAGMEGNLTEEANMAFHYITGWWRKNQTYPQWKADRRRRHHKNVVFLRNT